MDDLTRTISQTVSSAIEAQAKAQFLTALGGTDHLISRFLAVAANSKVKRNNRDVPLLDAVIEDAVKKVVTDLVAEMLDENRDAVKKALAARLRSSSKDVADQLVDHVMKGQGIYLNVRLRIED